MKLNRKNLNALSYKAKALMALERNREALIYIKEALAIKHNKTLYKYLIELENKSKSFNLNSLGLRNDLININENTKFNLNQKNKIDNRNQSKNKKKQNYTENKEEYKKIFDYSSQFDLYYQNENFDHNGK